MEVTLCGPSARPAAKVLFCGERPFPQKYAEKIETVIAAGRFSPQREEIKVTETAEELLFLAGKPEGTDVRRFMRLVGKAVRAAGKEKVRELELDLTSYGGPLPLPQAVRAAAAAALEAAYEFGTYKPRAERMGPERVLLTADRPEDPSLAAALREGVLLGEAVLAAREVTNRTSRDLTPQALTEWVVRHAAGGPYEAEVLDRAALEAAGAEALLSVALGAKNPPAMVILRYRGDPDRPERITALLGKGITFDSGGLPTKSKNGMLTMHHDMGGAAAAAAALDAAARMGLPLNLTAILPICENMPSPVSYRPGDVIGTMDGKTVLIKSTDAEGRLVLADAMTYAIRREGARRLVDIATLTGGAVSAYGPLINAVAVTDELLRGAVFRASGASGELVWEMPMPEEYKSYLKAEHADLANSSNGAGSSMINAALFLKEFTDGLPWLHIDCAGTAWSTKTEGCLSYGATGAGTLLLYELARVLSEE